eukprot:1815128-Pleurochrysis_carterae.AAC.2
MKHPGKAHSIILVLRNDERQGLELRQGGLAALIHAGYGEQDVGEVVLRAHSCCVHAEGKQPKAARRIRQQCSVTIN